MMEDINEPIAVFAGMAGALQKLIDVWSRAVMAFGVERVDGIGFEPDGFDGERDWRSWAFRVQIGERAVWAWAGYEVSVSGYVECASCGVWDETDDGWYGADGCESSDWFALLRNALLPA